jgi:hypothetical protein
MRTDSTTSAKSPLFPRPPPLRPKLSRLFSMPMRPAKPPSGPANTIPRYDHEPLNRRLDNQPTQPPPTPPVAEPHPAPRRVTTSQKPVSLVVRNTRKTRKTSLYTRSNHYLLAKSLVEDNQPPNPLSPKLKPTGNHETPRFCCDVSPPGSIISDFIWQFSAPHPDSQIHDAFAALKSFDPETFAELFAGFD